MGEFFVEYCIFNHIQAILNVQGIALEKGGKTMLGRNSRLSKNIQKTKTPRQKAATNVEASNEMKGSAKNCKSCSNSLYDTSKFVTKL